MAAAKKPPKLASIQSCSTKENSVRAVSRWQDCRQLVTTNRSSRCLRRETTRKNTSGRSRNYDCQYCRDSNDKELCEVSKFARCSALTEPGRNLHSPRTPSAYCPRRWPPKTRKTWNCNKRSKRRRLTNRPEPTPSDGVSNQTNSPLLQERSHLGTFACGRFGLLRKSPNRRARVILPACVLSPVPTNAAGVLLAMGCETRTRLLATYKSSVKLYVASVETLRASTDFDQYLPNWKRAAVYRQQCASTYISLQIHIDQHECGKIGRFELADSAWNSSQNTTNVWGDRQVDCRDSRKPGKRGPYKKQSAKERPPWTSNGVNARIEC